MCRSWSADGVRLRPLRDGDIARRAAVGAQPRDRTRLRRGPRSGRARDRTRRRRRAQPPVRGRDRTGVIADRDDEFVGVVRLAPRRCREPVSATRHRDPGPGPPRTRHRHRSDPLGAALGIRGTPPASGEPSPSSPTTAAPSPPTPDAASQPRGRFRDSLLLGGQWHDDLSMAILKPQWTAQQASAAEPVTDDA